jgi:hypothetical protein
VQEPADSVGSARPPRVVLPVGLAADSVGLQEVASEASVPPPSRTVRRMPVGLVDLVAASAVLLVLPVAGLEEAWVRVAIWAVWAVCSSL